MTVTITPSSINGILNAPTSKSVMQRIVALALLNNGSTEIINHGISNDDKAALRIAAACGAEITYDTDKLLIKSDGRIRVNDTINCGESGLSLRMFTPVIALSSDQAVITGEGSLLNRSLSDLLDVLLKLNVSVSNDGSLPINICGPLIPKDITIDGSKSSQHLTGLLFAFAAAATKDVTISVERLKSKPYIDLSINLLKQFGYTVSNHNYEQFVVSPVIRQPQDISIAVEGDWSAAAFLLVAGAISGEVMLTGLDINSSQGDKIILEVLKNAGANLCITEEEVVVSRSDIHPFHFDATDYPDLFPPLAVLAAYCNGISTITGCKRLINKESNRAVSIIDVLSELGIKAETTGDDMLIYGTGKVQGGRVHSHNDHRIAMCCAIAGLNAESPVIISDAESVNKSYPLFFEHLVSLGVKVEGHKN